MTLEQKYKHEAGNPSLRLEELEISITSKCHLRCDNCGFFIPQQPNPSQTDNVVTEIVQGLSLLQKLNVKIGSLNVLGGEPSFNQANLERALREFSAFDNVERIEVVSHGLTPQNISRESLKLINKLSISIYFESEELLFLWKSYLDKFAPTIELSLRIEQNWDKWLGNEIVDDQKAQEMFNACWYRKKCITLERQRLFICSRIAKLSQDHEGLVLNSITNLIDIKNYLNQTTFISSCKTCIPMMGLPTIKSGQQPDDRILKMLPNAIDFLKAELKLQP